MGIRQNEKYNAAKMEEHKRDHSLYIAFAPIEAPTIALAIVVENAGFGSEAAAPIARRVFDYVLIGVLPSDEDIALTREGKSGAPIGKPRPAAEVPLPGATTVLPPAAAASAAPAQRLAQGAVGAGAADERRHPARADERGLRAALGLAAPHAGVHRLRRAAVAGHPAAGRRRAC